MSIPAARALPALLEIEPSALFHLSERGPCHPNERVHAAPAARHEHEHKRSETDDEREAFDHHRHEAI